MHVTPNQRALAADVVRALAARFPAETFDDPEFTEAALRDVFENTLGRERMLLTAAARTVPPSRFARSRYALPDAATLARIDPNPVDARWACDAWRAALRSPEPAENGAGKKPPVPIWLTGSLAFAGGAALLVVVLAGIGGLVRAVNPQPDGSAAPAATASASPELAASPAPAPTQAPVSPGNSAAVRRACLATWRAGEWSEAKTDCGVAANDLPNDPLVALGLGEADVALKQFTPAVAPLESAAKLESAIIAALGTKPTSNLGVAYENRGYANYELGIATGTTEYYRRSKDDFHDARHAGVRDATVLYYFGDSAYLLNAWCDAALAFTTLLKDPQDLDASLKRQAAAKLRYAAGQCQ